MSNMTTTVIMIALTVLIIGWDVWLAVDRKDGNTISERMRAADRGFRGFKYIIIFGFGLLTGHWWW